MTKRFFELATADGFSPAGARLLWKTCRAEFEYAVKNGSLAAFFLTYEEYSRQAHEAAYGLANERQYVGPREWSAVRDERRVIAHNRVTAIKMT